MNFHPRYRNLNKRMPVTPNSVFPKRGGDFSFRIHDQSNLRSTAWFSNNTGEFPVHGLLCTTLQTFPISFTSRHPHFIEVNTEDGNWFKAKLLKSTGFPVKILATEGDTLSPLLRRRDYTPRAHAKSSQDYERPSIYIRGRGNLGKETLKKNWFFLIFISF